MAKVTLAEGGLRPESDQDTTCAGHPTEQVEIEENAVPEEEINYPTGPKLWLTVATLCVTMFLKGLVRSPYVIAVMKSN
jgi:hypothetical protein